MRAEGEAIYKDCRAPLSGVHNDDCRFVIANEAKQSQIGFLTAQLIKTGELLKSADLQLIN
ncbi:MAG: hypothetical protein Q8N28_01030 [bacterium]|nr:hypothetical protein [bacterium]